MLFMEFKDKDEIRGFEVPEPLFLTSGSANFAVKIIHYFRGLTGITYALSSASTGFLVLGWL